MGIGSREEEKMGDIFVWHLILISITGFQVSKVIFCLDFEKNE
jgi:hypothetical protein